MVLDISVRSGSLSIQIDDPLRPDFVGIFSEIEGFMNFHSIETSLFDFRGLVPRMVRGVAGCESGCPADAKDLVSKGYDGFELQYIEGGILQAASKSAGSETVTFRLFPDF